MSLPDALALGEVRRGSGCGPEWTGLAVDRPTASRVEAILEDLAEDLWARRGDMGPALQGLAGAGLFLGLLGRRRGFETHAERARALLGLAVARAGRAPRLGLHSGFVGVAWCVEHLSGRAFEAEPGDPDAEVDEVLLEALQGEAWPGPYDLIDGLAGLGVYGLERLPRPSGRRILERVLAHLARLALPCGRGLAWPTPPGHLPDEQRRQCPDGYLNLGVAHGVPGVLVLLAAMTRAGVLPEQASGLLEGGLAWFRSQIGPPAPGGRLADWCPVGRARAEPGPGANAWCYGDLGAALALGVVARLTAEAPLEALALDLARGCAARPAAVSGVRGVSLCHGSAGNLHLFHRLQRLTGEPAFRTAALACLDRTLEARVPGEAFGGFPSFPPGREAAPGFLDGAAGVGLALLAALEDRTPGWDRLLLLDTPFALQARR